MKLAKKLKLLREEKGITQDILIRETGLSPQAIRNYENEELDRLPNTVQLKILKDYFDVTYEYLLDEDCLNKSFESVDVGKKYKLSDGALDSILDLQRVCGEIDDGNQPYSDLVKKLTTTFSSWLEKIDISDYVCLIKEYEILNNLYEVLEYFSSFEQLQSYIYNTLKEGKSLSKLIKLLEDKSMLVKEYIRESIYSGLDDHGVEDLQIEIKRFKDFCKKSNKETIAPRDVEYILAFVYGIGKEYQEKTERAIKFCLFELSDRLARDLKTNYGKIDNISIPSEYKNLLKKEGF